LFTAEIPESENLKSETSTSLFLQRFHGIVRVPRFKLQAVLQLLSDWRKHPSHRMAPGKGQYQRIT
jgi:hypothetical protein